jgi:hypothetical protein
MFKNWRVSDSGLEPLVQVQKLIYFPCRLQFLEVARTARKQRTIERVRSAQKKLAGLATTRSANSS